MIVLVCGSRGWTDREILRRRLLELSAGTIVLHGDARGADRLAGIVATELGFHVAAMPALWDHHGRSAGHKRNAAMLSVGPSLVLAFWDGASPGTAGMVRLARDAGVPVEVITRT